MPNAITSRNSGSSVLSVPLKVEYVSVVFFSCKRTGPISDGCFPSRLFSSNKCWYVIGVTLYFPMSKVGSTVNGRYSIGLQQKRLRSLSCRSVVKTHNGSGATRTSLIKAVFLLAACFLLSPKYGTKDHRVRHFLIDFSCSFCPFEFSLGPLLVVDYVVFAQS